MQKMMHKVGVKILSGQQLENVLPTYENLFHKIDICRAVAAKTAEEHHQKQYSDYKHYQYNFMYDNVFSILGRRGTGKTSVAFTLREMIQSRYHRHQDVVMPLIIPEVIPAGCTILGWLLAIVKEEITLLENNIKECSSSNKEEFWNTCNYNEKTQNNGSLIKLFDELSQLFYAKGYNPGTETSYDRAIDNSARQADDYYQFAVKIAELWDAWVQRIRDYRNLSERDKKQSEDQCCPMLYFMFDDVDLDPDKIEELLSVIIRYLSHPNIIVITTADEEMFLEVLENRLDMKIGRCSKELRNYIRFNPNFRWNVWTDVKEHDIDKEDGISQTAKMYLGKVLPTSTRFYLRLFNTAEEKALFCLDDGKSLGEGVADLIQSLIECSHDNDKQITNFMRTDRGIIYYYLRFIGNTSRQIGNVYIAIQDLVRNLENIIEKAGHENNYEMLLRQIYILCRYFLCVSINSNHTISDKVDGVENFVDEIFLYEYNNWKTYCDYMRANDYLQKKLQGESKGLRISIGMQIFSLLSFVENILLIMETRMPHGITCRAKTHDVPYLAEYIEKTAFNSRAFLRSDLEPNAFFAHYVGLLNRMEIIVEDDMPDVKFNIEYFCNFRHFTKKLTVRETERLYIDNRKWFGEMVKMLVMVYGNAYLFDQKNMEDCLIYSGTTYLIRYQKLIDSEMKKEFYKWFEPLCMEQEWQNLYLELRNTIFFLSGEHSFFTNCVEQIKRKAYRVNSKWITLKQVLEYVVQSFSIYTMDDVKKLLKNCPSDIRDDFKRNWIIFLNDRAVLRDFMLRYKEQIKMNTVGETIVLYDVAGVIDVLKECALKCYPYSERISDWIQKLSKKGKDESFVIMDKNNFIDFSGLLKNIYIFFTEQQMASYYEGESDNLSDRVREIFGCLDVLVEMRTDDQLPQSGSVNMQKAVRLGIQIMLVKLLQRIYVFQTIGEKYDARHSLSSWGLERTDTSEGEKETFYYQFMQNLQKLMEDDKSKKNKEIQVEYIKEDINNSCMNVRGQYINMLIERAEYE